MIAIVLLPLNFLAVWRQPNLVTRNTKKYVTFNDFNFHNIQVCDRKPLQTTAPTTAKILVFTFVFRKRNAYKSKKIWRVLSNKEITICAPYNFPSLFSKMVSKPLHIFDTTFSHWYHYYHHYRYQHIVSHVAVVI